MYICIHIDVYCIFVLYSLNIHIFSEYTYMCVHIYRYIIFIYIHGPN